ncbi:MAG: hypothetical protein IV090_24125 [Candidatus Sericytochromatia bacterium]|nr:hypothetical protein [Candidatus Sericytochromatia bacterium]
MTNLSISRLESQLLQQVEAARGEGLSSPSLTPTQRNMVQYAFRDFVSYFLQLEYLAEAARKQKQVTMPPPPSSSGGAVSLSTTDLHLKIQVAAYEVPADVMPAQGQPVTVKKYADESSRASLIEIFTPVINAAGVTSYQVTAVKLALSMEQLSPDPSLASGGQVGLIPAAEASGSAGDSLQQFFERATDPQAQAQAQPQWSYENEDALALLEEEERLQKWAAEQHMDALIEAAYKIMAYMNANELQVAFGMSEEDKALMMNALNNDPAEVAQAVLKSFIRKRRVELDMLRKEIKERQDLEEAKHKLEKVPPQFEKILNFFDKTERMLDTQKFDKNALRNMMNALDQLNESLGKVLNLGSFTTP